MSHSDKQTATQGIYTAAIRQSVVKLDPRSLWRNPVMFVTAVVAAMTTVLGLRDLLGGAPGAGTALHISAWLWLCVLFANFAEALAEGAAARGRIRCGPPNRKPVCGFWRVWTLIRLRASRRSLLR